MKRLATTVISSLVLLAGAAMAAEIQMGHSAGGNEVADAFLRANDKMMRAMGMTPTGDADRDFAMMMIPHHQGAIDMAKIELQFGKDPTLRAMADAIIKAQEAEIAEFRDWQAENPN